MRVKRGLVSHRKHKKLLEFNKGYRMTKRRLVKVAKEAYLHAGEYAFAGRKQKKRDIRKLWTVHINGGLQGLGITYSRFINALKKAKIELDRKILSEMILEDFETFKKVVEKAKG